ncbi:MAG: preprotein translocase subunit SecE [Patescibacteria group bacterium]
MISRVTTYLRETRQEMKKVNWPTRRQATQLTIVVIIISLAVALLLGFFDFIYNFILSQIIS